MGEPSVGTARQYRGDSTEICVSSSPWFCSEDIPSDSWDRFVVQIEDVLERRGVKFFQGKSRPSELTLKFAGIEKELVLNITNRRVIDAMFTPAVSNWLGKWVTLYVQKGIPTKGGELKNGIRFRDDGPKGARPPVQSTPPPSAPKQADPVAAAPTTAPSTEPAAEGPFGAFVRAEALTRLFLPKNREHLKAALVELKIAAATPADVKALPDADLERLDVRVFDLGIPL